MSNVVCPLGLIGNCQSFSKTGKGCVNFDYCHSQTSLTLTLPYSYYRNRLVVHHTKPQVFRHSRFTPAVDGIENYHPLSLDANEELEKLGFAIAQPNSNFKNEIWERSPYNDEKTEMDIF